MTMKYESTDSSSSSLSSSCTSDGNAMDVNHPNYKKNLISTIRKAKSRKAKSSSELEPNSSTDEDGSSSSVCNIDGGFQKEKELPLIHVKREADVLIAAKDSAPPPPPPLINPEWPPLADQAFEKNAGAWTTNINMHFQGKSQGQHMNEESMKEEEKATNPMDKEVPTISLGRNDQPNITLVKSNSVSATKADNMLKLDYITSSSNSYHAKLQGHRLSTGDSPLHMQKRYGSQGPASHRTGFPSPGTPSRSSFSGVPTLMLNNKAAYYNMVGRLAVNEGNGKLLPVYTLPPCCDHDPTAASIAPGRLSIGFSSRPAAPPSKWDDAEKWLVNASPSHPSQTPSIQPNKQAANYTLNQAMSGTDHHHYHTNKQLPYNNTYTSIKDHPPHHHQSQQHPHPAFTNAMHDSYIQSRSLVPMASSSSDGGQMHEDGGAGGAMSDSELSNTQEECKSSAFVRSTSHRQSSDVVIAGKSKNYMKKGQLSRKAAGGAMVSKEELAISSPVSLQLERLKLGSTTSHLTNDQLPRMHDVYAVETTRNAGPCADEAPCGEADVAASSSMTRLVVQAGKVVGRWGAGAMRDASTDVSPKMSMSRRDMGTQMTPVASCKTSRAATPRKSGSPVRHNTPTFDATFGAKSDHSPAGATEAEGCHTAKLNKGHVSGPGGSGSSVSTNDQGGSSGTTTTTSSSWKSLQESLLCASSDHNSSKPYLLEMQESLKQPHILDNTQYSAWEDAERSKHMTKCAREEAKIDAWESHQKAKAEAEL